MTLHSESHPFTPLQLFSLATVILTRHQTTLQQKDPGRFNQGLAVSSRISKRREDLWKGSCKVRRYSQVPKHLSHEAPIG